MGDLLVYVVANESLLLVAVSLQSHIIHSIFYFDSLLKLWPEKISRNNPVKIEFSLALGGKTIFPKIKKYSVHLHYVRRRLWRMWSRTRSNDRETTSTYMLRVRATRRRQWCSELLEISSFSFTNIIITIIDFYI